MDFIKSLRRPKLAGIAVFDTAATGAIAIVIAYVIDAYRPNTHVYALSVFIFLFLILVAIGVHYITDTPTMLNYYIGINTLSDVMETR